MEELYRKYQGKTIKDDYGKNSKEFIDFANDMKKSMKINAAKYGLRLITFETGHYDMCGYFKDNETKKYAYFSFHECRNHPIDFDMMNSKGFLIRSAKGLNDCTGGREIGRRIAEELQIAYYDQEIITEIVKRTALSEAYIRQIDV